MFTYEAISFSSKYGFIYCFNEQLCAKCTKSQLLVSHLTTLSRQPEVNESVTLQNCHLWHHVMTNMHILKSDWSKTHVGKTFFLEKKICHPPVIPYTWKNWVVSSVFLFEQTPLEKKNWQTLLSLVQTYSLWTESNYVKRFVAFVVT